MKAQGAAAEGRKEKTYYAISKIKVEEEIVKQRQALERVGGWVCAAGRIMWLYAWGGWLV